MLRQHGPYEIDDARERFDVATVQRWLATTYWWNGADEATPQRIARACAHSASVIGAYLDGRQVACARVVSDLTRFAWLADVFVEEQHRGRGLARAMVRFALDHPDYATITRFMLATHDAHGVYAATGFTPLAKPQSLMERRPPRDN